MEIQPIVDVDDLDECVKGAVISAVHVGHGGLHIALVDGRFLVFPDAAIVAICNGEQRTLQ